MRWVVLWLCLLLPLISCQQREPRAEAIIVVRPEIPAIVEVDASTEQDGDSHAAEVSAFIAKLKSASTARRVVEQPTWQAAGGGTSSSDVRAFQEGLEVRQGEDGQVTEISILFSHQSPDLALAGAKSLVEILMQGELEQPEIRLELISEATLTP
jgi:hypothetical protein